ncbi:alpha/beta hydrolase [Marinobacter litoralis]|uniref:alpha/beta hydrolase n=1 Tax=Marinobacter litoralis TaxID=187981 RepID=UPI0018EB837B|nr:alpha/beta hydrolase [Marinobacter litoralis]MBJ6138497.1 alpha/beta hydrolase [Marinobacter litoralis]
MLAFVMRGSATRVANMQLHIAARLPKQTQPIDYDYHYWGIGDTAVPGHTMGAPFAESDRPVVLWLHGGAFVFPTMPDGHLLFVKRLCRSLLADAFVPDYRLAPANPFPAGLDDCERAYRLLLDSGVAPGKIIIGGESAGGNLLVALLLRLRDVGLPLPACAVSISPILDMARLHGPTSRAANAKTDAMLPLGALAHARDWYVGTQDAANPEISPLMGDFQGLPPLLIQASHEEVLRDDSVLFARKASEAGVETELALWPSMPHAFPLLEEWIPEAKSARHDIVRFIQRHLDPKRSGHEAK